MLDKLTNFTKVYNSRYRDSKYPDTQNSWSAQSVITQSNHLQRILMSIHTVTSFQAAAYQSANNDNAYDETCKSASQQKY